MRASMLYFDLYVAILRTQCIEKGLLNAHVTDCTCGGSDIHSRVDKI